MNTAQIIANHIPIILYAVTIILSLTLSPIIINKSLQNVEYESKLSPTDMFSCVCGNCTSNSTKFANNTLLSLIKYNNDAIMSNNINQSLSVTLQREINEINDKYEQLYSNISADNYRAYVDCVNTRSNNTTYESVYGDITNNVAKINDEYESMKVAVDEYTASLCDIVSSADLGLFTSLLNTLVELRDILEEIEVSNVDTIFGERFSEVITNLMKYNTIYRIGATFANPLSGVGDSYNKLTLRYNNLLEDVLNDIQRSICYDTFFGSICLSYCDIYPSTCRNMVYPRAAPVDLNTSVILSSEVDFSLPKDYAASLYNLSSLNLQKPINSSKLSLSIALINNLISSIISYEELTNYPTSSPTYKPTDKPLTFNPSIYPSTSPSSVAPTLTNQPSFNGVKHFTFPKGCDNADRMEISSNNAFNPYITLMTYNTYDTSSSIFNGLNNIYIGNFCPYTTSTGVVSTLKLVYFTTMNSNVPRQLDFSSLPLVCPSGSSNPQLTGVYNDPYYSVYNTYRYICSPISGNCDSQVQCVVGCSCPIGCRKFTGNLDYNATLVTCNTPKNTSVLYGRRLSTDCKFNTSMPLNRVVAPNMSIPVFECKYKNISYPGVEVNISFLDNFRYSNIPLKIINYTSFDLNRYTFPDFAIRVPKYKIPNFDISVVLPSIEINYFSLPSFLTSLTHGMYSYVSYSFFYNVKDDIIFTSLLISNKKIVLEDASTFVFLYPALVIGSTLVGFFKSAIYSIGRADEDLSNLCSECCGDIVYDNLKAQSLDYSLSSMNIIGYILSYFISVLFCSTLQSMLYDVHKLYVNYSAFHSDCLSDTDYIGSFTKERMTLIVYNYKVFIILRKFAVLTLSLALLYSGFPMLVSYLVLFMMLSRV